MSELERYGPWAAITGAGQGIGAAFAAALAADGLSLLLVDRDGAALSARATELRPTGVEVRELVLDLAGPDAAVRLADELEALDLGLLVSNAAVAHVGPLLDQGLEAAEVQLDVNCRLPLVLVHRLLPRLVARGRGGIVLLSSLSAMRGAPLVAGYAATKAWNLVLAESLWDELRGTGVDMLAVLPGNTRTPGWLSSRPQSGVGTSAPVMEPAEVAREALDALGRVPSVVPGQANRDAEAFLSSMERPDAVRLMGDAMREMYPPEREPDPRLSADATD